MAVVPSPHNHNNSRPAFETRLPPNDPRQSSSFGPAPSLKTKLKLLKTQAEINESREQKAILRAANAPPVYTCGICRRNSKDKIVMIAHERACIMLNRGERRSINIKGNNADGDDDALCKLLDNAAKLSSTERMPWDEEGVKNKKPSLTSRSYSSRLRYDDPSAMFASNIKNVHIHNMFKNKPAPRQPKIDSANKTIPPAQKKLLQRPRIRTPFNNEDYDSKWRIFETLLSRKRSNPHSAPLTYFDVPFLPLENADVDIFGITKYTVDNSSDEIKCRIRLLTLRNHPDKFVSLSGFFEDEEFQKVITRVKQSSQMINKLKSEIYRVG